MGGVQRRKGTKGKNKTFHRTFKTRHYKRDQDQVHEDIKPENQEKWLNQEVNEDLPGLGQHYCIPCARYFNNDESLKTHLATKVHKKSVKRANEKPYTIEEAEECGKF
ncbi:hypothetical protein ABPG72_013858 [Tetrahymena utriculariae]